MIDLKLTSEELLHLHDFLVAGHVNNVSKQREALLEITTRVKLMIMNALVYANRPLQHQQVSDSGVVSLRKNQTQDRLESWLGQQEKKISELKRADDTLTQQDVELMTVADKSIMPYPKERSGAPSMPAHSKRRRRHHKK